MNYLAIENLALRARSVGHRRIGSTRNHCVGMMESWSIGIMGLAELVHFFEYMR